MTGGIGVDVGATMNVGVGMSVGVAVGGTNGGELGTSIIACSGTVGDNEKRSFFRKIYPNAANITQLSASR